MADPEPAASLMLCLVSDDELVQTALRLNCPPPCSIEVFPMEGIVNARHTLSEHGQAIVSATAASDALLIAWDLARAPVINTLCYHMRRSRRTPVIGLCRGGPEEQVAAVAAGTDDAMSLPLYVPLLQAKVLAYHRLAAAVEAAKPAQGAAAPSQNAAGEQDLRQLGALRLDRKAHRFYIEEEEVELTPREFALLNFLIENAGALCTRDQILARVWGISFNTGTNMVDVYMHFLRRKLEARGLTGILQTVRGHGYRLVPPETSTP